MIIRDVRIMSTHVARWFLFVNMLLNCISAGVVTGYSETIGKFAGLGYFHFKYHNDNPGIFNSRVPAAFGYSLQL